MGEYVHIGFTKKVHGVNGELKAAIEPVFIEDFAKASAVFLKISGQTLPYFLEYIRGSTTPIIKFEDIDTPEAAVALAGKPILLRESEILADEERELSNEAEEELVYAYLKDYILSDKNAGVVGPILDIIEMPQQEMAEVAYKNKTILIPLNENLIRTIDKHRKTIIMQLPEGMLDL